MKCSAMICSFALIVVLFASGCSSSRLAAYSQPEVTLSGQSNTVALTTLEPARAQRSSTQRSFQLGAGDALGQAIFANYAAIARANAGWQYANAPTGN
jgi:hypothetical protein